MRVRCISDQEITIPYVLGVFAPGQELEVDDALGARLLRNVHFEQIPDAPAPAPAPVEQGLQAAPEVGQ